MTIFYTILGVWAVQGVFAYFANKCEDCPNDDFSSLVVILAAILTCPWMIVLGFIDRYKSK